MTHRTGASVYGCHKGRLILSLASSGRQTLTGWPPGCSAMAVACELSVCTGFTTSSLGACIRRTAYTFANTTDDE